MASFLANPFYCFLVMTGLNSLLAYAPLAWPLKLTVCLAGFGTLAWAYLRNKPQVIPGEEPVYKREIFSPAPWLIVLALVLALAVRLYKLTSFLTFPIPDELINAYNSIHLNGQWTWNVFFYYSQMPPFYIWLLALVFKIGGISSLNLWLLPALISFLSVIIYYKAFQEIFSRSLSLICLFLLAMGFWPVFLGRFSHNAVLMILWEGVALWLLAKFSKADPSRNLTGSVIVLGLCMGLGFYTYFGWALVALWFIPAVWKLCKRAGPQGKNYFFLGLAAALVVILPLIGAAAKEGFGAYLRDLFLPVSNIVNLHNWGTFQWDYKQNLYYLTSLLWTGFNGQFAYNPQWGGFLNPILGSLFLLGSAEMIRLRRLPLVKWLASGFAVILAPCLLTHVSNWYHLSALMPLFMAVTALGFGVLWSGLPQGKSRIPLILFFSLASIALDWTNLEKTMAVTDKECSALNPTVWACESLQKIAQSHGPGYVFSDFCLDFNNPVVNFVTDSSSKQTYSLFASHWFPCYMALGVHSFNALVNPNLTPDQATWASITTDEWAKPLLTKWFPGAFFYSNLHREEHAISDNSLLVVIPLKPENRKILESWKGADEALQEADYQLFNHPYSQPYDSIISYLQDREFLFRDNPFLRFYYWGKLADLYYLNNQYDQALPAFQKALQDGADGFLYYNLGDVLRITGRYIESKQAYQEASKWDSYYQPSSDVLQKLDALINTSAQTPASTGK